MAYMLIQFDADWDEWKPAFDSDPAGRAEIAKSYSIARNVDTPDEIFVRLEFDTVDEARTFRDRLVASGVLDRFKVGMGPTVVDIAETGTY